MVYYSKDMIVRKENNMPYQYSQLDRDNANWFANNLQPLTLEAIAIQGGKIRGVYPVYLNFEYPITAIAGRNGSGKSTMLALACCAYHNTPRGYIPLDRTKPYYTFRDFFISTYDEEKPEGIVLSYCFLGDWMNSKTGERYNHGWQTRKKRQGGKWTDYERRPKRNVVFLGIQRIVPPSEKKTERSYSSRFRSTAIDEETKKQILEIAGRIMGKRYTSLDLRTVDKRRLFVVDRQIHHYSGFNMGAGENAIFTILIELFSAGKGSLLVIDEIELGLHEEAQRALIEELKKICKDLKCQIICSTHSSHILDALPPEGRKFIETYQNTTTITSGISSAYATGKLSGQGTEELTILVEDDVGKDIIREFLSVDLRHRVRIIPIGSDQAVLRQLAAHFREKDYSCIAFLDGDKHREVREAKESIKRFLEKRYNNLSEEEVDAWLASHLRYLPGETCPEKWLLNSITSPICSELSTLWGSGADTARIIEAAQGCNTHAEFHFIAEHIGIPVETIRTDIIRKIATAYSDSEAIVSIIQNILQEFEA